MGITTSHGLRRRRRPGACCAWVVLFLCALGVGSAEGQAAVINVPTQAPTILNGIIAAQDGDTVLIADGVYDGPGNVELDTMGKAITIRSASGNPETCIIDGGLTSRAFIMQSGEGEDTVISGLTMRRCVGVTGGAMFITNDSAPMITHCIFAENEANFGGGVYCDLTSPVVSDCTFIDNIASASGGGFYAHGGAPLVMHCLFTANTANFGGGGMRNAHDASAIVLDCMFESNSAGNGGALLVSSGTPTVSDCRFTANAATTGGAVAGGSGLSMNRCLFIDNVATQTGGALQDDSEGFLPLCADACIFAGNSATLDGGAIASGSAELVECLFEENFAGNRGGAIFGGAGSPSISGCAFRDNDALQGGACFLQFNSFASIAQSGFCGNQLGHVSGRFVDRGGNQFAMFCCVGDFDADGMVGTDDLDLLIGSWGPNAGHPADLDDDASVGPRDLARLLNGWGKRCTP